MAGIVDGAGSGIKTNQIVEDLVKLERQPIAKMEERQAELNLENKALEELRIRVKKLQDQLRTLYNFEAGFAQKLLSTSAEGFLEGVVNKKAKESSYLIDVKRLASFLTLGSHEFSHDQKLDSSRIKINDEEHLFGGGTAGDLNDFLNKNFSKLIKSKLIRVKPDKSILIIESQLEGEKGLLNFSDSGAILEKLGIVDLQYKNNENPEKQKQENQSNDKKNEELVNLIIENEKLISIKEGPFKIGADKNSLTLNEVSIQKLGVNPEPGKRLVALQLRTDEQTRQQTETDSAPLNMELGEKKKLNFKGIEVYSYTLERQRETIKLPENFDFGIVLHTDEPSDASKKISLMAKPGLQRLPLANSLRAIEFFTENKEVLFSQIQLIYEKVSEKKENDSKDDRQKREAQLLANQKKQYPNLIKPAQNALLNLDGIDIEREKNKEIGDIIDGVALNLLKESNGPIKTTIVKNTEKGYKQINDFVAAYNDLLNFAAVNSTADISGKVGDFKNQREKSGLFVSNTAVRHLINNLKMKAADVYPAKREPQVKIMPMLGISTGKIGAEWKEIAMGLLTVDEAKLKSMLNDHPDSVMEFFGIDSDGDRRIDDGFAYVTEKFLQPYSTAVNGIISAAIKANNDRVADLKKKMEQHEEHVARYRTKLKEKFGHMEGNVMKQKATGNYLRNRLGNNGGD